LPSQYGQKFANLEKTVFGAHILGFDSSAKGHFSTRVYMTVWSLFYMYFPPFNQVSSYNQFGSPCMYRSGVITWEGKKW